jgi:hypothetical protein
MVLTGDVDRRRLVFCCCVAVVGVSGRPTEVPPTVPRVVLATQVAAAPVRGREVEGGGGRVKPTVALACPSLPTVVRPAEVVLMMLALCGRCVPLCRRTWAQPQVLQVFNFQGITVTYFLFICIYMYILICVCIIYSFFASWGPVPVSGFALCCPSAVGCYCLSYTTDTEQSRSEGRHQWYDKATAGIERHTHIIHQTLLSISTCSYLVHGGRVYWALIACPHISA